MIVVVSLGGSVLTQANYAFLKEYANVIKKLASFYEKCYVVVGGGKLARDLINVAKQYNFSNNQQDMIGIKATRINALLFAYALGYENYEVPYEEDDALARSEKIVVMGGVKPGQSTDAVAANLAVKTNASILINVTSVNGVYNKDPNKYKDAVLLKELCYNDLIALLSKESQTPGNYPLFDLKGLNTLKESNISLYIINGLDPNNILNYKNEGTQVKKC